MKESTRPLAVRIRTSLHEDAAYLSRVTGRPVREFVEAGLARELQERIDAGGSELQEMMQRLKALDLQGRFAT